MLRSFSPISNSKLVLESPNQMPIRYGNTDPSRYFFNFFLVKNMKKDIKFLKIPKKISNESSSFTDSETGFEFEIRQKLLMISNFKNLKFLFFYRISLILLKILWYLLAHSDLFYFYWSILNRYHSYLVRALSAFF